MKHSSSVVLAILATIMFTSPAIPDENSETHEHEGMCDASAAVAIGHDRFLVADDEDNILRLYRNDDSGKPVDKRNLTWFLGVSENHSEADLEGATQIGERIYWIGSHSTSKDGEPRPNRHRLFAIEVEHDGDNMTVTTVGEPYKKLVDDLTSAPQLKKFKLDEAAEKKPGKKGLNIEGLAATPEGDLLIGFRGPLIEEKALIVPLKNPKQVTNGERANLGQPILLPLGGRGIRSIEYVEGRGKYLIIAGPPDDDGTFQLYQWSGSPSDDPDLISEVSFEGLGSEALIVYRGEHSKLQVLSDDGERKNDVEIECKDLDAKFKRFRSLWIKP